VLLKSDRTGCLPLGLATVCQAKRHKDSAGGLTSYGHSEVSKCHGDDDDDGKVDDECDTIV
jgi:hypothetical protein